MRWLWMTAGLALMLGGCAPTSGVMLAAQPGLAACADLTYRGPDAAGRPGSAAAVPDTPAGRAGPADETDGGRNFRCGPAAPSQPRTSPLSPRAKRP